MSEYQHEEQSPSGSVKGFLPQSTSQILAVVTLLPVGGLLLGLAGLTFIGTLIGLAVTSPLFVIFSPILVPAVVAIGLAVLGFLTSGAFGITALSSLSWIVNYIQKTKGALPQNLDQAKRRVHDTVGQVGQKAGEERHRAQEPIRS